MMVGLLKEGVEKDPGRRGRKSGKSTGSENSLAVPRHHCRGVFCVNLCTY